MLFSSALCGQEKEYTSHEIKISTGKSKARPDSGSIRDLGSVTGLYLRAPGPVSSAGLSIRGAAPAHTEVSWHGIPLASPLIAQADVSLISPLMLRRARLREGGPSETGFCSAFGGSLLLGDSGGETTNRAEAGLAAGSFGQMEQWLEAGGEMKSVSGKMRCWNSTGKWNYPIRIGNFSTRMNHQERQFAGLEASGELNAGKQHKFDAGLWIQQSERQLPGMLLEENPGASQDDRNQRVYLRHRMQLGQHSFRQLIGVSRDELHFQDFKSRTDSKARSEGFYYRADAQLNAGGILYFLRGHFSRQAAVSGQSNSRHLLDRQGAGISAEIRFLKDKLLLRPGLNLENAAFPGSGRSDFFLLPAASLEWYLGWGQVFSLNWQGHGRNPGLNDLFWPGSGNPLLRAERGFTQTMNWKSVFVQSSAIRLTASASCFFTRISDYILWLPEAAQWKPQNAGRAEIRGLSLKSSAAYAPAGRWKFGLLADIQLSRQQLQNEISGQKEIKKMPFQPEFQACLQLSAEVSGFSVSLRQMHQGERLTGFGVQEHLKAFQTSDLSAEWQKNIHRVRLKIFAEALNIFHTSYYLLPAFPMPGRNFKAGISLQI